MTFFAVPYALFPAMAGYGLGSFDSPGLFFYLIVTIITSTSTSVCAIFENRYFVLFGENTWWRHVRKFVIAGSYIMVPLYFLPAQFLIPEQESARKIVWETLGCQPEIPPNRDLFVLSTEYIVPGYSIVVAEAVPSFEVITMALLLFYSLLFKKTASNLSQRTLKMQKKLVYALTFQCIAILFLFSIPINVVVYSIKFEYHSQAVNNLVFFSLSLHGSASTLIMIFIHNPYRNFCLYPFNRLFRKVPVILVRARSRSSGAILERF